MDELDLDTIKRNLYGFARQHNLKFDEKGECGFGRSCVGFSMGDNWLDYNPYTYPNFDRLEALYDERLRPTSAESDAYHKHQCFAVLVYHDNYENATRQLHNWIARLRSLGTLKVVSYSNGATDFQAILSGVIGYTLTIER